MRNSKLFAAIVLGAAPVVVWAQPPQPPAPTVLMNAGQPNAARWNEADLMANRIQNTDMAGPTTIAHNLVFMMQSAFWAQAAFYVAGVDVTGESKAVALLKKLAPDYQGASPWTVDDTAVPAEIKHIREQVPAEGAETEVNVTLSTQDFLKVELRSTETIKLRREKLSWPKGLAHEAGSANVWRIVPPTREEAAEPGKKLGVIETYALMLSDPEAAMEFAGTRRSLAQVKMLGLGVMQFTQDWKEKFDMDENNWPTKLQPYVRHPDTAFTAPGDAKPTVSYSFNPKLAGKMLVDLTEPAQTVLLYLGKDGKLDGRYKGLATVCYADGHVEMVAPDTKLRWEP